MSLVGHSMAGARKRGPAFESLIVSDRAQARQFNNHGLELRADGSTSFGRRARYRSSAPGGWIRGLHLSGFVGESVRGQATLDLQSIPDNPCAVAVMLDQPSGETV
ncbi:MAG: hypothetical protein OXI73_08415 [Rhodospirillales bacterium]|nr:hypothetical protein [Rhodospirillales bacterium]